MSGGITKFYVHTLQVETFLGTSSNGDVFAAAVPVVGFMESSRKLVRDKNGQEVVSESQFYTYPANAATLVPDSRITYNGAVSRVILPKLHDSGSMNLPDHVEVTLT